MGYRNEHERVLQKKPLAPMAGKKIFPKGLTALNMIPREVRCLPQTRESDHSIWCKTFDSRGNFLSFCKTTECQFDTLRRAKHSTMILLHHLHTQDTPTRI